MRISKLSELAGLPVGTVKFYLRSGLLHPGLATSATQALYDETHLARLRMIRALLEVGGLALSDIQRVLDAVDSSRVADSSRVPGEPTEDSLAPVDRALVEPAAAEDIDVTSTRRLLLELGWQVSHDSPHLPQLARALAALASVGVETDRERLKAYADAASHVARQDLAAIEQVEDAERPAAFAASQVLFDPVFSSMRRLAREHHLLKARSRIPAPRVSVPQA